MNAVIKAILVFLIGGIYLGVLVGTVWGWTRWALRTYPRSLSSTLSLIGLTFATASVALAISSAIYAHEIGGFPYYDPLLMKIYRTGAFLSLLGIVFSAVGAIKENPLRWHAGVCAIGTLIFWFISGLGE